MRLPGDFNIKRKFNHKNYSYVYSFSKKENAEKSAKNIRKKHRARIIEGKTEDGKDCYRVYRRYGKRG